MITLLINGQTVTTQPGEVIALQKAATKVGDLQSRQGSFTNDFAIPATAENVAALGFASILEIIGQEVTHTKKIDAILIQDGMEIGRGYIQIVEANYLDRTITITFFGGTSDWVSKLSGISIRDIDLSALDHDWTLNNIRNARTATEGYIYPLIDYGNLDSFSFGTDPFSTEDFYPALYQKTLLAYAFSEIGYKVGGSFVDEFQYQHAIIPFSEKSFLSSPEFSDTFKGSMTGQQLYQQTFSTVPQNVTEFLNYGTVVQNDYNNFSTFTNQFTADRTETYRMMLEVDIANFEVTNTGGVGFDTTTLSIVATDTAGNTVLSSQSILDFTGTGTQSTSGVFVFEFDWAATVGDKLNTQFNFTTDSTTATSVQYIAQFNSYTLNCLGIDRKMAPGDLVEMAYVMPDIQVLDVIRDMVQRHGLIVTTNDYTQTVHFDRFELMPKKPAVDWSDKVSISGVHRLDFTSAVSGYSRVNLFKYAESNEDDEGLYEYDSDNSTPLGQGQIEIDNEFLSDESVLHESIFKASIMHSPFDNNAGVYVPLIQRYGDGGSDEFEPGARILYVIPDALVQDVSLANYSFINMSGTLDTTFAYAYFYKRGTGSDLDNLTDMLSFGEVNEPNVIGETLISQNYRELENILNNGKSVEVSVQLREDEFVNLDFSVPVLIDAGWIKGYFFVNEVEDYQGGLVPCKVSLIEV